MALRGSSKIVLAATAFGSLSVAALGAAMAVPEELVVDPSELTINPANGLRMLDGQPFTGRAEATQHGGQLARSDSFVEGLRDGPSRMWFPSGRLGYEAHFSQGEREGLSRTWWRNGNLRSKTNFVADKQEGEAWVWYSTGEKYKRHHYSHGVATGLQKAWRKNGKLFENFEVRGGRSYGLRNSKICYEVKETEA